MCGPTLKRLKSEEVPTTLKDSISSTPIELDRNGCFELALRFVDPSTLVRTSRACPYLHSASDSAAKALTLECAESMGEKELSHGILTKVRLGSLYKFSILKPIFSTSYTYPPPSILY